MPGQEAEPLPQNLIEIKGDKLRLSDAAKNAGIFKDKADELERWLDDLNERMAERTDEDADWFDELKDELSPRVAHIIRLNVANQVNALLHQLPHELARVAHSEGDIALLRKIAKTEAFDRIFSMKKALIDKLDSNIQVLIANAADSASQRSLTDSMSAVIDGGDRDRTIAAITED